MMITTAFAAVIVSVLITAAACVYCVWIFWSAARALPKQNRMRLPWLIWLLLLPLHVWIFDQVLPLVTLLPLTWSYQRYFRENQIRDAGDCGFRLAMAYWLLSFLDLLFLALPLGLAPAADVHSPAFLYGITSVSMIGRVCGWVLLLLLAVRMWFLRRAALAVAGKPLPPEEAVAAKIKAFNRRRRQVTAAICVVLISLLAADQAWVHAWRIIPANMTAMGATGSSTYLAAVNRREAQGVTAANNALPLLIEAAGPKCFPSQYPGGQWMMHQLGLAAFTEKSESLITYGRWVKAHPLPHITGRAKMDSWTMENRLMRHPWNAAEHPSAAAWLVANKRALKLFNAAMRRSRYDAPLGSADGSLIAVYRPDTAAVDSLGHTACADAMFLLGSGDAKRALRMAVEVDHLARLLAQSPGTTSYLTALSICDCGLALDRGMADSGRLSADQLRALLSRAADMGRLPPLSGVLNFQRDTALDNLIRIDQRGLNAEFGPSTICLLQQYFLPVHYVKLLRDTNRLFEREAAAEKISGFSRRMAGMEAAELGFRAYCDNQRVGIIGSIASPREDYFGGTLAARTVNRLLRPLNIVVSTMDPRDAEVALIREAFTVRRRLTRLSIALALYKLKNGRYPALLRRLVPQYVKAIGANGFTGRPIHYARSQSGSGFLLSCRQPAMNIVGSATNLGGGNKPLESRIPARTISVKGGDWPAEGGN